MKFNKVYIIPSVHAWQPYFYMDKYNTRRNLASLIPFIYHCLFSEHLYRNNLFFAMKLWQIFWMDLKHMPTSSSLRSRTVFTSTQFLLFMFSHFIFVRLSVVYNYFRDVCFYISHFNFVIISDNYQVKYSGEVFIAKNQAASKHN